jgi:hypothetical protein
MGNNPNMSQSSIGFSSGDSASGAGIASGGTVPVYYGGPVTLPSSSPTPVPALVVGPKQNTSPPPAAPSSFNKPPPSGGSGARPAAAGTPTPPAAQGVSTQTTTGNTNPAPSTPLTAAAEQALERAKANEARLKATDQLTFAQAQYNRAQTTYTSKVELNNLARAVGAAWAGVWKANINLWFVGFNNGVGLALKNLLNAFVDVLNALANYQTSKADLDRNALLYRQNAISGKDYDPFWLANRNDLHDFNTAVIGLEQASLKLVDALYGLFVPNQGGASGAGS